MIERFKKGYFARSKAGHDKDTLYVILDRDDRFVYLSDGRLKEVNNPKKKKEKHLQFIASQAEGIAAAKRKGKRFGRPEKKMPDQFKEICQKCKNGEVCIY